VGRFKYNLFYNLVNQLLLIAFPLFLNIYLVRVLDLSDLGQWYLVNSVAALVQLLMTAPHFWLVRVLSVGEGDPQKTVAAGILTYFGLFLGTMPIFATYILWVAPETGFVAVLVSANLLMSALACEFYFHATLQQRFLMIRRLVTRSILVGLLVAFVRDAGDFHLFVALTIGTYIVEHLIGLTAVLHRQGLSSPGWAQVRPVFGSVRQMLPFNATHNTLPHILLLFSPRVFGLETVAVLAILIRLVNMMTTLVTSSVNVIFPYLSSGAGGKHLKRPLMLATGLVSAGLGASAFVLHRPIAWIFLDRALEPEQVQAFGILCGYIASHAIYNYIAFSVFVARSQTYVVTLTNGLILGSFALVAAVLPATLVTYAAAMTGCATVGLVCLAIVDRKT